MRLPIINPGLATAVSVRASVRAAAANGTKHEYGAAKKHESVRLRYRGGHRYIVQVEKAWYLIRGKLSVVELPLATTVSVNGVYRIATNQL